MTLMVWKGGKSTNQTNKIEPLHDRTNNLTVRPAKTPISLGIRPVWSDFSLCIQLVAKNPKFLHADSEDSDQTGQMPRLIWVFPGCTVILFVLSCCGSIDELFCITFFQSLIPIQSGAKKGKSSLIIEVEDLKEFKKLLRTRTNLLVVFAKSGI